MPETNFMERVEKLMAETGCTRELASQAVHAATPAPRDITKGERVLCRALSLMRNKGYGWSRAIDVAAQTVE